MASWWTQGVRGGVVYRRRALRWRRRRCFLDIVPNRWGPNRSWVRRRMHDRGGSGWCGHTGTAQLCCLLDEPRPQGAVVNWLVRD